MTMTDNLLVYLSTYGNLLYYLFVNRYSEDLELEDAVHTAILTLKEGFEGQMTEDNIEIGICNDGGFRWVVRGFALVWEILVNNFILDV